MAEHYLIQISGFGFIHKNWKDQEPQFSASIKKAKVWKTRKGAIDFGSQKLTPRLPIGWELLQDQDGELTVIMKPRRDIAPQGQRQRDNRVS